MLDNTKLTSLLQANQAKSAAANSTTIKVEVRGITGWKPGITKTGEILPTSMVVTDKGNFWPLTSAIRNMPTDFSKPHNATAVVTLRVVNGVERLNMSSLEFEGLDNEKHQAIKALPAGAALFANFKS